MKRVDRIFDDKSVYLFTMELMPCIKMNGDLNGTVNYGLIWWPESLK